MDMNLIHRRREEVTQEIHQLQKQIADKEKELVDLDTAERVIASLTGASGASSGPADERAPETEPRAKPEDLPTMPELIREALTFFGRVQGGARPKEVRDWIARHRWRDVPRDSAATNLWRMLQRGEVVKIGPRYKLSEKKETADENPTQDTPAASLFQPEAQGRKADDPGGGT